MGRRDDRRGRHRRPVALAGAAQAAAPTRCYNTRTMGPTDLTGPNAAYVAQLLEDYLDAPASVPPEWRPSSRRTGRPSTARGRSGSGRRAATGAARRRRAAAGGSTGGAGRSSSGCRSGARPAEASADAELLAGVAAAMALVKAYRMHGHLAARLDPLGSEPMGDPALDETRLVPSTDARAAGAHPREPPPAVRAGRDAARRAAAAARGLHRLERVRDRAHLRPRRTRLAAEGDRVRTVPRRARARGARAAAPSARAGRGLRAVPPPVVPRAEAVLPRGPGRADPDARRGDRARSRVAALTRSSSGWPTAVASTRSSTPSAARTSRSSASSRASAPTTRSSSIPRAGAATSSTTCPRRGRGSRRRARSR